ncbi:MAG TPA: stage V sporulation protein D [Pseudogracilibacillus sp.]|nr:stage V sporulation protein D [Pseudogracilibacillus sp.]
MKRTTRSNVNIRIRFLFLMFSLVVIVMLVRLAYVQFVLSESITNKAVESWLRDISFQPDRGKIVDRNGKELATNISATSVIIVPHQIKDKEKTAEHLASILQIDREKAERYVEKRASSVRLHPEGRKISEEQERAIKELNLTGVYLAKDSKRYYPHDDYLAHVLGFTGIDNQGLMGLEAIYDDYLKGQSGNFSYFSDAKGGKIPHLENMYRAPIDGLHLQTTIDLQIQTIVERELNHAQVKYNPDGAMALVVNPKTGGVLAMATRPGFHPSHYKNVPDTVFNRNLPIWSTFEPGSTFKIITLAAALEEGLVNLEEDHFFDKGFTTVGGARLRCWKKGGHGSQTMREVVENSCNPGFVHFGNLLGDKKLFSYIHQFGFGKPTGIDLQGEGSGILFKPEQVGPAELATTSFGQGVSVTPIQQVMAVAAAINGGYLYEPYIAEKWIDPRTNEVVEAVKPTMKRRVISEETSKQMRETLEGVVANGTGRPAYINGYRVGGKTGTAQKVGPDGRYLANDHIVSFIGFAPADDPELVVFVAIDNPKHTIQFGGVVSAPIVRSIIDDSLRNRNLPLREGGLEKSYIWPEQALVKVPDFIGTHKKDLLHDLSHFEVESHGEGSIVIDQEPQAGSAIEENGKIRLYLGEK